MFNKICHVSLLFSIIIICPQGFGKVCRRCPSTVMKRTNPYRQTGSICYVYRDLDMGSAYVLHMGDRRGMTRLIYLMKLSMNYQNSSSLRRLVCTPFHWNSHSISLSLIDDQSIPLELTNFFIII